MTEIRFVTGVAPPEPRDHFFDLLRTCEPMSVGGEGTLGWRLGQELQSLLAQQSNTARMTGQAIKGAMTLKFSIVTGPDGTSQVKCESATKAGKAPARSSSIVTNDDGDYVSRPRPPEPIIDRMYANENKAKEAKAKKDIKL